MVTRKPLSLPVLVFLLISATLLMALPYDSLRAYGDHPHFFNIAALPGLPYFDFWSEFPPLFPFLSELLYLLSGGVEHVYTYLLMLLLTVANLGSVLLFERIVARLDLEDSLWRGVLFAALSAALPYHWRYFDTFAVFFALLALHLALSRRAPVPAGAGLQPGHSHQALPSPLPARPVEVPPAPPRRDHHRAGPGLAPAGLRRALVGLAAVHRRLAPIPGRQGLLGDGLGSARWQLPLRQLRPAQRALSTPPPRRCQCGNPPVINPWLRLAVFGALGLFLFLRAHLDHPRRALSFAGLTAAIFLLWSPGWSVQWVLYLLPLILLTLPLRLALLLGAAHLFSQPPRMAHAALPRHVLHPAPHRPPAHPAPLPAGPGLVAAVRSPDPTAKSPEKQQLSP